MWDLIVSVPDHCLSFYLATNVIITFVTLRFIKNVYSCKRRTLYPPMFYGSI